MLTIRDIEQGYDRIKRDIEFCLRCGRIARAVRLIDTYADIAQQINDHFCDDDIEFWTAKIAEKYLGLIKCDVEITCKRIVFYDQIGSTICLGLQYIRGLIANGYEILYIFESPTLTVSHELLKELDDNHIRYLLFKSNIRSSEKLLTQARHIRQEIVNFNPARIVIHSPAFGALGAIVLYSLKGIIRYRIVPGDHHFYLGCGCTDYFFEFRNFGIKVALEQRHIEKEKIFKLPYYPIIDNFVPFQGFPSEVEGKVLFATAGATYKFYGSDWFFEFAKWLLVNYKQVVLLFIGNASPSMLSFIEREHLEGRFIPVGYRKDFVGCIEHIDVYINSYPYSGGLVSQTAAYFGKPIVSYTTEDDILNRSIRGILGAEETGTSVSFTDENALKAYVDRLIADVSFRIAEGERIHGMLQTKEIFDAQLGQMLNGALLSSIPVVDKTCNVVRRLHTYIDLQNTFQPTILIPLVKCYSWHLPFKIPTLSAFVRANICFFFKRVCIELMRCFVST